MKCLNILISCLLFGWSLKADIINVPADQPDIQSGINAATNGDTVLVADGTYLENINFMGKAITVASQFIMDGDTNHIANTVIDGSQPANPNQGSVVTFNSGEDTTSVLSGFTITGGVGSYWSSWVTQVGGGIWINGGAKIIHNIIVNNSVQHNNRYTQGGGIFIQTGTPTALPNGHVIVMHNKITQNSAIGPVWVGGGGITIHGLGTTRIASNIITQNSASAVNPIDWLSGGGGVFIWEATPVIIKNVISENTASNGGGIAASCDIYGFSLQLINNTIADNHAAEKGGGVYLFNGYCNAMNNIFWGNTAPDDPDIFYRGNMDITYSLTQGIFPGVGNMQADPLFANSAYHLNDASPAIDAGNPDSRFDDPADPNNPGQPLWPAKGTLRADMGGFGGNDTVTIAPASYPIYENFLYRQFGAMPYRFAHPLNYDSTLSYPLTVVLHGSGFWGIDNQKQLFDGLPWRINAEYFGYNEFTIVPQNHVNGAWNNSELQTVYALIQNTIANNPIDTTRIVIVGWSSGGGGTWQLLNLYQHFFAAGIPMSGLWRGFGNIKHVPVWAHHGTADDIVPVSVTRDYISSFENTGLTANYAEDMSDSDIQAAIDNHARLFYSEYVGAFHGIHRQSYDNYFLFEWLKKQRRPVIRPVNSSVSAPFYRPGVDSVRFTTRFSNPHNHSFDNQLIVENFDKIQITTTPLYDDGMHGDSLSQDGIWGIILPPFQTQDNFRLGVQVYNTTVEDTFYFHDLDTFTTISTGLSQTEVNVPLTNSLHQNYPNPFNPSTTIEFALPHSGRVTLKVYNVLGQEVAVLVAEEMVAGTYKYEWDASGLASGVYYYRLSATSPSTGAGAVFTQVRKMLLMR